MNDHFINGFISGAVGFLPVSIYNNLLYHFKLTTLRFSDFASMVIYSHKPTGIGEFIFAWISTVCFNGFAGVIFTYIILFISDRFYRAKGILIAIGMWFFIYSVMELFQEPGLINIGLKTALSNFMGSAFWGISTGYVLSKLSNIGNNTEDQFSFRSFRLLPVQALKKIPKPNKR